MILAIGEFQLQKLTKLPEFIKLSKIINQEAKEALGNLHVELHNEGRKTFFSYTAWDSLENMQQFVISNTHKLAMEKTNELASSTKFHHFNSEEKLPIETMILKLKSA